MKRAKPLVAIDGPAGSGKSTVAAMLACRLGFLYINTGAMYRAFTIKVLRHAIALDDEQAVARLAARTRVSLRGEACERASVLLDGEDVTAQIGSPEVTEAVSAVSRIAAVRALMVKEQRHLGANGGAVAEGRDTTTVVFPDAEFKFYLDADLDERTRRKRKDWEAMGRHFTDRQVAEQLTARDARDSGRHLSPLTQAKDAIRVDSTRLTPQQVVDTMWGYVRQGRPDA